MQIQFFGKNIDVTPAMKTFATEKLSTLEKSFSRIQSINMTFHVEHNTQIAEATVHLDGTEIHAHAENDDMYQSIDMVVEKLLHQAIKHKEKMIDGRRRIEE